MNFINFLTLSKDQKSFVCVPGNSFIAKYKFYNRDEDQLRMLDNRITCFACIEAFNMIVVGGENGLIEIFEFELLSADTRTHKAHTAKIISIHYDEAVKVAATCSEDYIMFVWNLPKFYINFNIRPDFYSIYSLKILHQKFNATINLSSIRQIFFQKLVHVPKSHLLGYDDGSFAISFELGLIAYGLEIICLFDFINYRNIQSRSLDSYIASLYFTEFYIVA